MFLVHMIKILFVIVTLLQSCHAMEAKEGAQKPTKDQHTQTSEDDYTQPPQDQKKPYSGLFVKQLEGDACSQCLDNTLLCMGICSCFFCCTWAWPAALGGGAGMGVAKLLGSGKTICEISWAVGAVLAYVPTFKLVVELPPRLFAMRLRETCDFFIKAKKLDTITEYLVAIALWDRLNAECNASLSWKQQACVINEYLKKRGCSSTVDVALDHEKYTDIPIIMGKGTLSATKTA